MRDDMQIRRDVEAELDWDARFDSRNIGVAVRHGVVALTGRVGSYAQRRAAEEAAQLVAGVTAVANDIAIELPFDAKLSDAEIAETAVNALKANVSVPANHIKLVVRDGWITLQGQVAQWHQKNAAETALISLFGVKGITNDIGIRPQAAAQDVQTKIEEAFRRHALLDAKRISVQNAAGTITLEGEVHSWQERQQAENAAWQAPGVVRVIDNISVRP